MAINILWTQRALAHLEAELDYYGNINPALAKELALIIQQGVKSLIEMPGIGRAGKYIGAREFIVPKYPYIIAYRVRNEVLEVVAFIHQKRKNIKSYY